MAWLDQLIFHPGNDIPVMVMGSSTPGGLNHIINTSSSFYIVVYSLASTFRYLSSVSSLHPNPYFYRSVASAVQSALMKEPEETLQSLNSLSEDIFI